MPSPASKGAPNRLACSWVEASSTGMSSTLASSCSSVAKMSLKMSRVEGAGCLVRNNIGHPLVCNNVYAIVISTAVGWVMCVVH